MAAHFTELIAPQPGHLGGREWHLKSLTDVTVLFGRNGSGKSALLRALLNNNPPSRHLTTPERAGEIQFNAGFAQEENLAASRAQYRQTNLSLQFRERAISRINSFLTKKGFFSTGDQSNGSIKEIEDLIRRLLPDFNFEIKPESPFFSLTRISNNQLITNKDLLSSGEAEMLSVGLDILTVCSIWKLENQPQRLLLIDEPDTHLHPDLQQRLADFIVSVADNYDVQVIVATHSTTLLSALGFYGGEKTSVIYLNSTKDEQKAIGFNETLQELSACLGGHALMGPLFGAPLLLVEGDDDYKIWSQVPRHHVVNFAVIPCKGDEIFGYQKTLEKIFDCLIESPQAPSGYALIDGDKGLPQANPDSPQNHIKFLQLSCHEAENLFFSDEVLSDLGLTWDQAKEKIKENAGQYGEKSPFLLSCETWDRKNGDIKEVINQVSQILDEKKVPWTKRVGSVIGRVKPAGELADFLGNEIIEAFWN